MAVLPFPVPRPLQVPQPQPALWTLAHLAGRLVEVAAEEDSAALTLTAGLVLDAQRAGEQVAWIVPAASHFFVPDLAENGVDLEALAVVRVPDAASGTRAADTLLRSGGFGLVVLDAGARAAIPTALLARLALLAQRHHAAVVFLTHADIRTHLDPSSSTLGSLISLRVRARRRRLAPGRFRCWLDVLKDKRRGPTWRHEEVCRGAPGLR